MDGYRHATRIWTVALEISVLMAQFPSREIAERSYEFRTLGLGYANLGTLLMLMGIPYDSHAGPGRQRRADRDPDRRRLRDERRDGPRAGAVPRLRAQPRAMLRVMRNHRRAAYNVARSEYEGLSITPRGHRPRADCPEELLRARAARVGRRARARREARLSQRPGERDRADRHDRPRHGLRHDGHRARLRAREVQEARRRRLLPHHQPLGAGGALAARLHEGADRRDRPLRDGRGLRSRARPTSTRPRCS